MKIILLTLALLGGAATMSHAAPKLAPAPNYCAPDANVDLIEAFVRLPDYVFRYFGGTNNNVTNLLDRKGVVVDKKNGYIEIPYSGNSSHPDRDKVYQWQMKIFRDKSNRPVAVVNNVIYSQTKVKPFLHVFRFKNGIPYRTTAKDFPYELTCYKGRPDTYSLSQVGNFIISGPPESDVGGYSYRWTGNRFVRFRRSANEEG